MPSESGLRQWVAMFAESSPHSEMRERPICGRNLMAKNHDVNCGPITLLEWCILQSRAAFPSGSRLSGLVLGIDPTYGSGFAVLDQDHKAGADSEAATLKLKQTIRWWSAWELSAAGGGFLNQHSIVHVAVEQTIYVQNFQTAQILALREGPRLEWRLCVDYRYSSMRFGIKQAVVGTGSASKEQVARAVQNLTGTDFELRFDESEPQRSRCVMLTWRSPLQSD